MKCDELKAYHCNEWHNEYTEFYLKSEVDVLLAKKDMEIFNLKEENSYIKADSAFDRDKHEELLKSKDAEIAELKARIQLDDDEMAGFLDLEEECGGGDLRNYIAELKQKLEDAKASHYAEMVDAGMENRRLRSALWLARAERAEARKNYWHVRCCHEGEKDLRSIDGSAVKYIGCIKRTNFDWLKVWSEVEIKCLKKAKEYK